MSGDKEYDMKDLYNYSYDQDGMHVDMMMTEEDLKSLEGTKWDPRKQEQEPPDLFLHTYPGGQSARLGPADDWELFCAWAATQKDLAELVQLGKDSSSDPSGDRAKLQELKKQIAAGLERIDLAPEDDHPNQIGPVLLAIGKQLLEAIDDTTEGIVVSDQH